MVSSTPCPAEELRTASALLQVVPLLRECPPDHDTLPDPTDRAVLPDVICADFPYYEPDTRRDRWLPPAKETSGTTFELPYGRAAGPPE
ncbi:MAG: hypothetical protein OXF78_03370 [Rhodospirillales bacterium]|nr:hypothetical protein [Rhodospirillales bacterium]MCY4097387.1 hypothetical protein [Rhodospirillales bacterium]